jgi:hypothetical protein
METAEIISHLWPEDFLHQGRLGPDHLHVDVPGAKRRRDLQADEARADHHGALRHERLGDERAAVRQRPQVAHVRKVGAGNVETNRLGAGGEQERVIVMTAAVGELHAPACRIDRGDARAQAQVDVVLRVEFRRPEEVRSVGGGAGEIPFRTVGPIAGPRLVGAQHGEAAGIAVLTKRFGSGVAGRAPTNDDNGFRQAN